ncbi:MAG: methylenetetrahydrofolate dehydrogenase (NADP+) / methenyltetrahydrofolate cyclohydrolase [Parcubacteria group bacterium Gr01-1014_30]|nr:MAG: methylenetetrahydrofolate dehydrogenase (NADP+) / methenyltetrahydrofolate cyclohydrolase [Parcubacteria group bacterium Gr01-1014_30]
MLLLGKEIANKIIEELKPVAARQKRCLAIVQVGQNEVSSSYVRKKQEKAAELGVKVKLERLTDSLSENELNKAVSKVAAQEEVDGMIVQLPLPSHVAMQAVLDCIPPEKDVDVLSSSAFGKFVLGGLMQPPVVSAVARLLQEARVKLQGSEVTVVGAGRLVGLPLAIWLIQQKATVHMATAHTKNLAALTKKSDIVISGAGRPYLIQGGMIKKGVVVIDVGAALDNNQIKGDVDTESVEKVARAVAPVPGGVGPLTVAYLLRNLFSL